MSCVCTSIACYGETPPQSSKECRVTCTLPNRIDDPISNLGRRCLSFHPPHHHVALLTRISLTHSRHSSGSPVAPYRSSRLYPKFVHNCCWLVFVGRPTLAWLCEGAYIRRSLKSSTLLLQLPTRIFFVLFG